MSAVALQPPPTRLPTPEDPFRYGYREVLRTFPDGKTDYERVGLTLEDVLHPQMGDHIVQSSLHDQIRAYLKNVYRARLAADPTALVLADCGIFWDNPLLRHHCPDVSVIFGVRQQKPNWPSFDVAEEGVRPRLLTEIVSPNTRELDVETKFRQYHMAGVQFYIIIDRPDPDGPWVLRGFERTPRKYLPLTLDEKGRLWINPVGVWLGLKGDLVICYDGETEEEIPDYPELTQRLTEEIQRAKSAKTQAAEEAQARRAAEQRAKDLEAEIARLKGQPQS